MKKGKLMLLVLSFCFGSLVTRAQTKGGVDRAIKDPARAKEQAKADVYLQKQTGTVVSSRILIQDSLPARAVPPGTTIKKKIKSRHKKNSR